MDVTEMKDKRKALWDKAKAITDLAKSEGRHVTKEEDQEFRELMARASEFDKDIAREDELKAMEVRINAPHQAPTRPEVEIVDKRDYNGQARPFDTFGQFAQAVMRSSMPGAEIDKKLLEIRATGLSEGVMSDGGFLVQTDFASELMKRTYETGQAANRCRRIGLTSNANGIKIPAIDETSRADGSRWGGIRAYWKAEGAQKTAAEPTFRQIELNLKKLTGLAYATDELLQDAGALEEVLMQGYAEEFGFKLDDAVINGDGVGKPLGILASPALVTVSKETGQPAKTLQPENIIKMWSRCYAKSRLNAVWFTNQDIEPQLFTLGIQVGTGGSTIYMPPGGLSAQPYGTLFGRPVIPIEQCATLGDAGDIILADLSQYILVDKGGIQSASSIHLKFDYDETVFRFVYRVDGQPAWQSVLTPYKGTSNTVSPFVTLAARA
jgi:HK97 family phage major capsid protein